ncbi:MAG: hypothetical protein NTZ90_04995 [Proteobacteria bacterium]|nr:hypothetical protein [Pseudomonadota bacterium]
MQAHARVHPTVLDYRGNLSINRIRPMRLPTKQLVKQTHKASPSDLNRRIGRYIDDLELIKSEFYGTSLAVLQCACHFGGFASKSAYLQAQAPGCKSAARVRLAFFV